MLRRKATLRVIRSVNPWLWILLAYMFISTFWSPFPFISFKRYIQNVGIAIIGISAVMTTDRPFRLLTTLRPALTIMFMMCIVTVFANPTVGIGFNGDWRGMYSHHNNFAVLCLLTAIISIFLFRETKHAWFSGILFILSIISLYQTHSTTGALVFVTGIFIVIIYNIKTLIKKELSVTALFSILLVATMGMMLNEIIGLPFQEIASSLTGSMGKDTTLTGRVYLWELMNVEISKHPWFGIGYGGFWLGTTGQSKVILSQSNWVMGSAHNGYLDIINELGYVGFALTLALLITHCAQILKLGSIHRKEALFLIIIYFVVIIHNFSESTMLRRGNLLWIVLLASIIETDYLLSKVHPGQVNKRRFRH